MTADSTLRINIQRTFAPLNTVAASKGFPAPAALASALMELAPGKKKDPLPEPQSVSPQVASMFATAAVEMWLRSVHSFMISSSVSATSPIWASVAGYYSSHYAIRATAHLLGCFQLFHRKCIVTLQLADNVHVCSFNSKSADTREHQFYWKVVKNYPLFTGNSLYTFNASPDDDTSFPSDVAHRERANYGDHLYQYPQFSPLDKETMKDRINFLAGIRFNTPPIPSKDSFPDVEAVQVLAYHRIVRFRELLDDVVLDNRFWKVHRKPTWADGIVNFQLAEQNGTSDILDSSLGDRL